MIQWNVIWVQSAVRRAVCQRAVRSRLGPPQFRWEPWYRASLVLSPHLGWTVRVFVPDCGHGWSWLDFLAHPCGLTDLLAMCGHCHQTCSALLAWSMCLCALLPEVSAVLTASPAHLCSSGSPSSSAAPQAPLPSSWHGPQHHRVSETPGEDGQWYERHYCYDNKADVAFLCLPSSTWEAKAKFRPLGASRDAGRAAGRRSSLNTALDPSQALPAACFKGIALDLPSWDFLAHKPPAAEDRGNFVVLQPSGPRDLFKTFSRLFSACFSHYDVFNCHYVRYLRYSGRCWGCLLVPRNGQVLYFPRKLVYDFLDSILTYFWSKEFQNNVCLSIGRSPPGVLMTSEGTCKQKALKCIGTTLIIGLTKLFKQFCLFVYSSPLSSVRSQHTGHW